MKLAQDPVSTREFVRLPLSVLDLDAPYQRRVVSSHNARKDGWNPNFAGPILVVRRSYKTTRPEYGVCDGKQRATAAMEAEETHIVCEVLTVKSMAEEVAFFKARDRRTTLSAYDHFIADLRASRGNADHKNAKAFERVCHDHGVQPAASKAKGRRLTAIRACRGIIRDHGESMLDRIFDAVFAVWGGDDTDLREALKGQFLQAVAMALVEIEGQSCDCSTEYLRSQWRNVVPGRLFEAKGYHLQKNIAVGLLTAYNGQRRKVNVVEIPSKLYTPED
jgi:hypothetical protein